MIKTVKIPLETAEFYWRLERLVYQSKLSLTPAEFIKKYDVPAQEYHKNVLFDAMENARNKG